jgi:tripartite-type tricarboxylate transporter receptor subunit TctC
MPAGTPREMVNRLHADLARALKSPETKERIFQQGGLAGGNSPEEFAAFIKVEMDKWARVGKAAKVRVE